MYDRWQLKMLECVLLNSLYLKLCVRVDVLVILTVLFMWKNAAFHSSKIFISNCRNLGTAWIWDRCPSELGGSENLLQHIFHYITLLLILVISISRCFFRIFLNSNPIKKKKIHLRTHIITLLSLAIWLKI